MLSNYPMVKAGNCVSSFFCLFVVFFCFFNFFLNIALLFSYSGLSRSVTLDISHHWGSAHGIGYDCVISTTSSGNRIKKRTSKMNVDENTYSIVFTDYGKTFYCKNIIIIINVHDSVQFSCM